MNILLYKQFADAESIQNIRLLADNINEKNNVPVLPALPY